MKAVRPGAFLLAVFAGAAAFGGEMPFVPIGELGSRHDKRGVRTAGTLVDAMPDEVDPRYDILLLKDGEALLPVSIRRDSSGHRDLLDAQVEVSGVFNRVTDGNRNLASPYVAAHASSNLVVLAAPPDPFAAPELEVFNYTSAPDVLRLGRRRASGVVLASWQGDHLLLCTDSNNVMAVALARKGALPEPGDAVAVSGYPETDFFRVNLAHASWRAAPRAPSAPKHYLWCLEPMPIEDVYSRRNGTTYFRNNCHGKTVRLRGVVRSMPALGNADGRLNVECGDMLVPVDTSAHPEAERGLALGCEVAITGTCLLACETQDRRMAYPHIRRLAVVVRGPDDVRILSRPPWWTPGRIWSVVGVLAFAVLGILVWNAALRALAERRGRQLLREQLEGVKARLKVDERTRMAVELHDSLSQCLTGVSMEIAAAEKADDAATPAARLHLDRAGRALKSCREELKNCIWDLRSQALEEPDATQAILRTLKPHVPEGSRLVVRFNVSRRRLSDNALHAVLRVARELAVNAFRHGDAKTVRIAGALDAEALRFSVADDGRGFDPDDHPGVREGHFGLQGVQERVKGLGGRIDVASAPGKGATVTATIPAAAVIPPPVGVS